MRLTIVGDALLDRDVEGDVERLAPDAPVPVVEERAVVVRAGGAGLAATLAAADGNMVSLVTALADDRAGRELRGALQAAGVDVVDVGLGGTTPEKIRIRARDRALLRLDRGTGGAVGEAGTAARAAIAGADAILVADYGRGMAASPSVRAALRKATAEGVPVVWDPHPRGPVPVEGVTLATPNAKEAEEAGDGDAARLRRTWRARAVCITCGADGAVLATGDAPLLHVPAATVPVGDPCGAGDRFASRAAEVLGRGGSVPDAVHAAVAAASAFVAAGGAAAVGRERAEVVVATGGCFDLLHPGHVATLKAARALGDRLVVCLNDDGSVRRLKGSGRPVVGQEDRAAVLEALECVDQVIVFGEDTPTALLRRLRPDVWVKGGDYDVADLPEAEALAEWGGRVVVLPFVEGRSTTRIIEEVSLHVV
jgi:D-beta-D-heptose 7-phosphate kinase / D-beta-D-heptose 1-phosphate adenosyltransferase